MWTWAQKTGTLTRDGAFVAVGYAGGNCGSNPEGVNNPSMQNVPKIGPLPQGTYTVGEPIAESKLGPFALPLQPMPSNEMFGRSDFYCHGDTAVPGQASEGCIILARPIRNEIAESSDKALTVVSGE